MHKRGESDTGSAHLLSGVRVMSNSQPDEEVSMIMVDEVPEPDVTLLEELNSASETRTRKRSVHELQCDLDIVLRDVTNLVDSCLASPYMPKARRGSKCV
jgi:hypothetical protein